MANAIKKIVQKINNNVELDDNLMSYATELNDSFYEYGLVEMAMNYYLLYEMYCDNEAYSAESVKVNIDELNDIVLNVIKEDAVSSSEDILTRVENLRGVVREKMDVIMDYNERLRIYEYVINRLEYKFNEDKLKRKMSEEQFVDEVYRYIFSTDDKVVVNGKIQSVMKQLPVRITKSKFFDLIGNSIKLYNKSDIASVKSYLYSIRGGSMLYKPEGADRHFLDIKDEIEYFDTVDFSSINKEQFDEMVAKHGDLVEKLNEYADIYLSIINVINQLYVIVLTCENIDDADYLKNDYKVCSKIIKGIYDLFADNKKMDISMSIDEEMRKLEGKQEEIQYDNMQLESAIMQIFNEHEEDIERLNLSKMFKNFEKCSMLMSTSSFVELSNDEDTYKMVDDEYIENAKEEITREFVELFDKIKTPVRRAIMANVLGNLPIFFSTSNEVRKYISNSFSSCRDLAEKYASMDLIDMIMYSDAKFMEEMNEEE